MIKLVVRQKRMKYKQIIQTRVIKLIQFFQHYVNKSWYSLLMGFLAFIDYFVIVIPSDGLIISSSMLQPKKWLQLAIAFTVGSTLGGIALFYIVREFGLALILNIYPAIDQGATWAWTTQFFDNYGLLVVFLVAASPFVQQPAVILAALSHVNFAHAAILILVGRFIKFVVLSYISSHSPKYLSRLWGIKGELEDVGIQYTETGKTK